MIGAGYSVLIGLIMTTASTIWSALGQLGALAAAGFAAWTAFETRRIAMATQGTLLEQQKSTRAGKQPILTVEPTFDFFELRWGPDATNGPILIGHNRNPAIEEVTNPSLRMSNWGNGPALEVEAHISLDDSDEAFAVPTQYRRVPHGSYPQARLDIQREMYVAFRHARGSTYLALPRKESRSYIPACGASSSRDIEFGRALLQRIFMRALQGSIRPDRRLFERPYSSVLTLSLRYRSSEETDLSEIFEFDFQTSITPDAANGSARELWDESDGFLRVYLEMTPRSPRHFHTAGAQDA